MFCRAAGDGGRVGNDAEERIVGGADESSSAEVDDEREDEAIGPAKEAQCLIIGLSFGGTGGAATSAMS